jgi:hypothetical protein
VIVVDTGRSTANGGDCVEVATLPNGGVGPRDSKRPDDGHLTVSSEAFRTFLSSIRTETP